MTDNYSLSILDSILKNFVNKTCARQLLQSDTVWENISRLTHNFSAKQCRDRYTDLLKTSLESDLPETESDITSESNSTKCASETLKVSSSNSLTTLPFDSKFDVSDTLVTDTVVSEEYLVEDREPEKTVDHGPMMVIHVCDESKSLKQDFYCPRNVLVKEMSYFSGYLSTDTHKIEDIDISVHCDIAIFDWLMKYIKWNTACETVEPVKLDSINVVSLLISSDFLKMSSLVDECIEYFHGNLSSILAAPCNMNCISDALVTRISEKFTVDELDEVKDRKDKFKSKLYMKKIEKLFDPEQNSPDSKENAATLFRCSVCKKLLTNNTSKRIKCKSSRMAIDVRGGLLYCHLRDENFNVNDYILDLKQELKQWRNVYWRLWGNINFLKCTRCKETFLCYEFSHCQFHTQLPEFHNATPESDGVFLCCHQPAYKYLPYTMSNGCHVRDHIVSITSKFIDSSDNSTDVYSKLLMHRDVICIPYIPCTDVSYTIDVFANEKCIYNSIEGLFCWSSDPVDVSDKTSERQTSSIQQDSFHDSEEIGGSDDELGDDECTAQRHPNKTAMMKHKSSKVLFEAPTFEQNKKSLWDNQRSLRWNQDSQRQEDRRRLFEIVNYLKSVRLSAEKIERQKSKQCVGGLFSRLDNQWKMANMIITKAPNPPLRLRPRPFQLKPVS